MPKLKSCSDYADFRSLKSHVATCPDCGRAHEIFSDELELAHVCKGCGKTIDLPESLFADQAVGRKTD